MGGRCPRTHQNTLNISAEEQADRFKTMLPARRTKTIGAAFPLGWQADYPSIYNFLQPLYVTGAASNKGFYSSSEFDSDHPGRRCPHGRRWHRHHAASQELLLRACPSSRCATTPTAHEQQGRQ